MRSVLKRVRDRIRIRYDAVGYARSIGVRVGRDCRFLSLSPGTFGSEPYLVSIGNHVTITGGVRFITHDGGVWIFRDEYPDIDVIAPISVGNNVFIGLNTIVMPGVTIGNNCVIGAGAVVTRHIPDNSVAVGTPARVISDTEGYKQRTLAKAIHVRSRHPREKRRIVEQLLGDN